MDSEKTTQNTSVKPARVAPAVRGARRTKYLTWAFTGLAIFALSFGGGWLGAASQGGRGSSIVEKRTILSDQADLVSSIAKEVGESVVSVNVTSETAGNPYANIFGYGPDSQVQESAGTGIILSEDGLILTNRHVVPAGTTSVSVTLSDGTVLERVSVVGRTSDRDSLDIAFLKVEDKEGRTLKAAKIGDSSKMEVGDSVVAIGNTLGQFQNTVTTGIISGYGRSLQASDGSGMASENLDDLFQTDAAINSGNSGGPLVNLNGEVIGVNTAMASNSQSVGFTIPINNVKGLIDSVKETGKLQRPYLGVVYVMLTDDIAKQYDLASARGAYIPTSEQLGEEAVLPGGPAQKAGLQPGDIITKINGIEINEKTSLVSQLGKYRVGDVVKLTILRGSDKAILIDATLAAAPSTDQ
jgi:serine protease Do